MQTGIGGGVMKKIKFFSYTISNLSNCGFEN